MDCPILRIGLSGFSPLDHYRLGECIAQAADVLGCRAGRAGCGGEAPQLRGYHRCGLQCHVMVMVPLQSVRMLPFSSMRLYLQQLHSLLRRLFISPECGQFPENCLVLVRHVVRQRRQRGIRRAAVEVHGADGGSGLQSLPDLGGGGCTEGLGLRPKGLDGISPGGGDGDGANPGRLRGFSRPGGAGAERLYIKLDFRIKEHFFVFSCENSTTLQHIQ